MNVVSVRDRLLLVGHWPLVIGRWNIVVFRVARRLQPSVSACLCAFRYGRAERTLCLRVLCVLCVASLVAGLSAPQVRTLPLPRCTWCRFEQPSSATELAIQSIDSLAL